MKIALDHIGILGRETSTLVSAFKNLGFQVNGPSVLQLGGNADGDDAVQTSAHIMFDDHYIELTSVNPCPPTHHLAPYLQSSESIRLLILGTNDICDTAERLESLGHRVTPVQEASRVLTYGSNETARFKWLGLSPDPLPGILSGFVEHQDAEAVFHPSTSEHPNTVLGIRALHCTDMRLPGVLALGQGHQVDMVSVSPNVDGSFFNGIDFQVADQERCENLLQKQGVEFHRSDDMIIVAPHLAGGATVRFGVFA